MEKLWDLRIKVIDNYEKLMSYKAIKSTADKISGYTDKGILMSPEAMQNTITLLEKARETNDAISGFGRSKLKINKTKEEKQEEEADNILSKFGRSVCTTEEDTTALERVKEIEKKKKLMGKSEEEKNFIDAMRNLENYMNSENIEHSFRCREEKLSNDDIEIMIEETESLDVDDQSDKIKVLRNINKMKDQTLFDFCDKKPYQCLVCPFYYKDMKEFLEMKNKRKEYKEED